MKKLFTPKFLIIFSIIIFCVISFSLASVHKASAATCSTVASGDWTTAGTWGSPCNVAGGPVAGDVLTIASGHTVTISTTVAAAQITINNAGAATGINMTGGSLTLSGTLTCSAVSAGTGTTTIAVGARSLSASGITLNGSSTSGRICAMTVGAGGSITTTSSGITFSGTAAQVTFTGNASATLNLTGTMGSGGTVTTNSMILTTSGTASMTQAKTWGALTVSSGTFTVNGASTFASANVTGNLLLAGVSTTISGTTTINSGGTVKTASASGTKTFTGDVTVNSGGTFDLSNGGTYAAVSSFSGNITNDSANNFRTSTTGLATLNGIKTLGGSGVGIFQFGGLTLAAAARITLNKNATVNNNLTLNAASSTDTSLTHGSDVNLTVTGTATLTEPTSTGQTLWNVNAGNATVTGTTTIGSNTNTASRVAKLVVTTGIVQLGALTMKSGTIDVQVANAVIDLSGGAGTLKISGAITRANLGTITPGTTSTVIFNGTAAQTIPMGTASNTFWGACTTQCYANLTILNTQATTGATLGNTLASGNVSGDITVGNDQNAARFSNGGYAITGIAGKTFLVNNLATFRMTGSAENLPATITSSYDSNSNIEFDQTSSISLSTGKTYGNVKFLPASSSPVFTLPATITINGNLTIGGGGATATSVTANTNDPVITVAGDFSVANASTFTTSNIALFTVNGNTTIGGGTTGTFTAAAGGGVTFNGNLTIAVGATYTKGVGTVTFSKGSAQTITDNTTGCSTTATSCQDLGPVATATAGTSVSVTTNIELTSLNIAGSTTFEISSFTLNLTGTLGTLLTKSGTFSVTYGTVAYIGTSGTPTVASGHPNFYNLTTGAAGGTAVYTLGEELTVSNTLTIGSNSGTLNTANYTVNAGNILINGGTFTPGSSTINLSGTTGTLFTKSSGTLTANTATVNLASASGTPTVASGISSFYNLSTTGDGIFGLGETLNVTNSLTITEGTLNTASEGGSINTGGISPGTVADDATVGTVAWSNPDNVKVSDNAYSLAYLDGSTSHYLKATNFGFSIPTDSIINGILIDIEANAYGDPNPGPWDNVRIVKGGTISSTSKSSLANLPYPSDTNQYISLGSSTDLWGETWTYSDINSSTFGVVASKVLGDYRGVQVDHIRITIYYTTTISSDYNISAGSIAIGAGGTLTANSSTISLSGTTGILFAKDASGTFTAGISTIKYTDTGNGNVIFDGGGGTYNNIWFSRETSTGSITIVGTNTFSDFRDDGTAAHSILFTAGTTTTVSTWTVSGTAGNLITINSTTTGTHTLVKTGGGVIDSDYLNIQHSIATPANTWYAGANSVNNNGVSVAGSGWIFSVSPRSITISNAATTCVGAPNWVTSGSSCNVNVADIESYLSSSDVAFTATGSIIVSNSFTKTSGLSRSLSMYANENITINAAINTESNRMAVLLNADRDANSLGYVDIEADVFSNGGDIIIGGGSGTITAGSGFAVGNADYNMGVLIFGANVSAGPDGSIVINGQGSETSLETDNNDGVMISSASVNTTGSGTINITGNGGVVDSVISTTKHHGISVYDGIISTANGNLTMHGIGGGTSDSSENHGILIEGLTSSTVKTTGSGDISITGTGGNDDGSVSSTFNTGVYCHIANCIQTTGSGTISVTGTGSSSAGGYNNGIMVSEGSITGNGRTMTITGTGGNSLGDGGSNGSYNMGVQVVTNGAIGNTGSGILNIYAYGGGLDLSAGNTGLEVSDVSVISTVDGDLTIEAIGGGTDTSSGNNGIDILYSGSTIQTTGEGDLSITGTGGNGSGSVGISCGTINCIQTTGVGTMNITGIGADESDGGGFNYGILGSSASIHGAGGAMTITGIGGDSTGNNNQGIRLSGTSIYNTGSGTLNVIGTGGGGLGDSATNYGVFVNSGGAIYTANGDVAVTGTGGGAGTGANNYGVYVSSLTSRIRTTGSGNILVTGVRGGGDTASNYGVNIAIANGIQSQNTGDVTIITDTINLAQANDINSIRNLSIKPYTTSETIGLGAGSGTLALTDTKLGYIAWGTSYTLTIGGTTSGNIDINTASTILNENVTFLTGGNITLGTTELAHTGATPATLNMQAYGNITTTSAITASGSALTVNLNADYDANASGAISIGAGIGSNGGLVTILGGGGTLNTTSPYDNLTINTPGNTVTLGSETSVALNGVLTISAGTFNPLAYLITGNGVNTLNVASGAILKVGAPTFAENYSSGFTTKNFYDGSTVDYSLNGAQTILNTEYYNLIISAGGTKSLEGELNVKNSLSINAGTVDTTLANNYNINSSSIILNGGGIIANNSIINLTGIGTIFDYISGTITAGTSTIKFIDDSSEEKIFNGGGQTYNDLLIQGSGSGEYSILGSNIFNNFTIDTPPHIIKFGRETNQNANIWDISGKSGNLNTLRSTVSGAPWTIATRGNKVFEYLAIENSIVEGDSLQALNSEDLGSNMNWIFGFQHHGGGKASGGISFKQCNDDIDNDGDGKIDFDGNGGEADQDCSSTTDDNESSDIIGGCLNGANNPPECTTFEIIKQCNDDIDNDGDGKIDFDGNGGEADPDCSSTTDDNESTDTGGGGGGGGGGDDLGYLYDRMNLALKRTPTFWLLGNIFKGFLIGRLI